MLQGTSSHVGKSILTSALCRIFYREGLKVTPFKAQNMALNSFVTVDGLEIGRAQAAQAQAACIEPSADMNPVLLKPTGNSTSQVIINGKAVANMSAAEYHRGYSLKAFDAVKSALNRLDKEFEMIVIEGAGSPAEINLKDNDIANMRVAKYLNSPVLLVADIDRGGSLASIVGTLALLDDDERDLIKGVIINKFRGDINLFTPAVDFLEKKTGKPIIGVVPFIDNIGIDDEDSVSLDDKNNTSYEGDINIFVIRTPKISNFTDFDSLIAENDINLKYISKPEELINADLIIIPGSKNTAEDLKYLRSSGFAEKIIQLAKSDTAIAGICGGFQMLGEKIIDTYHTESDNDFVNGLNLLPITTFFAQKKLTTQINIEVVDFNFLNSHIQSNNLHGYEIHAGVTDTKLKVVSNANILGTYIHGIFDNDDFRLKFLNAIRLHKGLKPKEHTLNINLLKQNNFNRLADVVHNSLNFELLNKIIGL